MEQFVDAVANYAVDKDTVAVDNLVRSLSHQKERRFGLPYERAENLSVRDLFEWARDADATYKMNGTAEKFLKNHLGETLYCPF